MKTLRAAGSRCALELPTLRRRVSRSMGVAVLFGALSLLSGCQVGRTWFHMDSNAPMPFFGFDLLPRRTADLRPPDQDRFAERSEPPVHRASDGSAPVVSPVNDTTRDRDAVPTSEAAMTAERGGRELRLPRISSFLPDRREEDVTFQPPTGPFTR
jgi:hypothetical protein